MQDLQHAPNRRNVLEKLQRLVDGHIQHVRDIFAFVRNLQRLGIETRALAYVAGNVNVGQKVHRDFEDAIAAATFAPPAFDVEAESSRLVAAHLRSVGSRKKFSDMVGNARISCDIRARRPANRVLVNQNNFVDT